MNNTLEEKFTSVIIRQLNFKKADMAEYHQDRANVLKGCPINSEKQGCISAVIQQELAETIQRELAKTDSYAQKYQNLANDPHKLLIQIFKDLNNVVFEPILDQIATIINKAAGEDKIVKENGIRVAKGHNAKAMIHNGKRIESSYNAESLVIMEGRRQGNIDKQDHEKWNALAKIDGGIATGLKESVQTIKFILSSFGEVTKDNMQKLFNLINKNGKNFIKRLASQPSDPGAKFVDFIAKANSENPKANTLLEMISNFSYSNDIIGLTNNSIGIKPEELEKFITSYKEYLVNDIQEAESLMIEKQNAIETLSIHLRELEAKISKPHERRVRECALMMMLAPPQLANFGLKDIKSPEKLAEITLEILQNQYAQTKAELEYCKMEKAGIKTYIRKKKSDLVFRCPAANARVDANNEDKKGRKISIVEAFYKLISERFIKTLELANKSDS